jgi:transglutaminase-like putative cysteine protease
MIKFKKNVFTYNVETGLRPVSTISIRPVSTISIRPVSAISIRPVSVLIALVSMLLISCSGNHLINDSQYMATTEKAFARRKLLAVERDSALFTVFKKNLSIQQSEALKFLYAFMPLNDLSDYNGDFFLANADISLRARAETKWGKDIPQEIYLHYVLPMRINNENLDSFRIVYFDELMNRVKGKDLREAALEINHWCHEKVSYQAADIRTSAPMSTILSARGRCGEESTFTVAALRTAGIPARQVYTPRWAHSDDNHAWVEIWYGGEWYYMGACEPEPVLDRGWFTEPARRAMLVHTKSFGAYWGSENAINKNSNYTIVNNLAKYAVTKRIFVKVLDGDGLPVREAKVEYQLYNYAEFYPLAVIPTDNIGISQFETGLGDLIIWASKDDYFDFKKISVSETDTLTLRLSASPAGRKNTDLDLDVPIVRAPYPLPAEKLIEKNTERVNHENEIRQKYIDSWMKPSEAVALAKKLKIDTIRVKEIIARSMGNYKEISSFLSMTTDSLIMRALSLLETLPDKDLRDTKSSVLTDHLINAKPEFKSKIKAEDENVLFNKYILNPRVANEILVPWRHYFLTQLPSDLLINGSRDPLLIVRYLTDKIKIADEENYYKTPLTPIGVNELKVSDIGSRAICFVAICRTLGIPSRLEPGRNTPQYFLNGIWNDVYFSDQKMPDPNKGYLMLKSTDTNPVPEYYIHFTIARFEGGRYNTLEYDFNKKINDFKEELPLPPGKYMLVTGNRISDSKILSNISFFDLSENEHKTLEVRIRKDVSQLKILGKIDLAQINSLLPLNTTSQACSNDKGIVVIWIDPEKEPTKHIFNDIPLLKTEMDAWGGTFLFLSQTKQSGLSDLLSIKGLPSNTIFSIDDKLQFFRKYVKINESTQLSLPFVIKSDKDGNINFISSGYRIGIGEQILKSIR